MNWLKLALTGLLAFAAVVGLTAVLHDRPYVYPVFLRSPWLTTYVRASPQHVAIGAWRTSDDDLRGHGDRPYWQGAGMDVYTETVPRAEEHRLTSFLFDAAAHSARLGEFGAVLGHRPPLARSRFELLLPTWLTVLAGVVPFVVVAVRLARRHRLAMVGHCRTCGYDLRATPGVCPECGTSVAVASSINA